MGLGGGRGRRGEEGREKRKKWNCGILDFTAVKIMILKIFFFNLFYSSKRLFFSLINFFGSKILHKKGFIIN